MGGYSISDALSHAERIPPTPPTESGRGKRRRRLVIGGAFGLVVLAGAGFTGWWFFVRDSVFDAPQAVELPAAPDDLAPVREFLSGTEGSLVVRALGATAPLTADPSVPDCEKVAAALDAIAPPQTLFSAAAGIPDGPTSEMAVSHLSATTHVLGDCLTNKAMPDLAEVTFTSTVLRRRLDELQ